MELTYYFPFGYFHPVSSGATSVAAQHLAYFRSRGIRPRIVVLGDATASPQRREFERHYHWAADVCVIDLQLYPEIEDLMGCWGFHSFLAAHAAIAETPKFREYFAEPADVVMLNYVFATPLLDACPPGSQRVLETHDILSRHSVYPGVAPLALQHQLKTEFSLYDVYDLVIMLNHDEELLASQRASTRVRYVPRAVEVVDECSTTALREEDEKYDLLFIGSRHPPNVNGIHWFYEHVFAPHLKRRGLTMAIAGTVCDAVEFKDPAVTILGRVDDLGQTYRDAKIIIVPLFEGTGISIKTLEAMGQGKPIVTTQCGRRGLRNCDECLLCLPFEKAPVEVAERIVELARSPAVRENYGRRAREYASLHFSAEAYGRRMDEVLGPLTERSVRIAA